MGPPSRSLAADAYECIMDQAAQGGLPNTRLWRDTLAPAGWPASDHLFRNPSHDTLTEKAPYKASPAAEPQVSAEASKRGSAPQRPEE